MNAQEKMKGLYPNIYIPNIKPGPYTNLAPLISVKSSNGDQQQNLLFHDVPDFNFVIDDLLSLSELAELQRYTVDLSFSKKIILEMFETKYNDYSNKCRARLLLDKVNTEIEKTKHEDKMICSYCCTAKDTKSEILGNIMNTVLCKECYNKDNSLKILYDKSLESGYYD